MERLIGKSILVGREEGKSRLMIAIEGKVGVVGYDTVPNGISRCKGGSAHCRIEVVDKGHVRVTNLKPQNTTCVNGMEIETKTVNANAQLQLGKEKYSVSVDRLLKAAGKLLGHEVGDGGRGSATGKSGGRNGDKPEVSIAHLEPIWNGYDSEQKRISKEREKMQLYMRVPMVFTMGSGALSALANMQGWPHYILIISSVMTVIGFVLMLYSIYMFKNNSLQKELDQLKDRFEDTYICPHCQRFIGWKKFKLVQQDGKCSHCGAKYKWKQQS